MATTTHKGLAKAKRQLADDPYAAWQTAMREIQASKATELDERWGVAIAGSSRTVLRFVR